MDFTTSEEQAMLADSVARFIDHDYDFETRQKIAAGKGAENLWTTFADLGWTAVPFDEADGGLDGGPVELMLMMEQFGRGLVVEPFLANIVLAGGVLRRCATDAQKSVWLTPLIDGELQAALAFAEPQARYDLADILTTATADGDGYRLDGTKTFVLNGGDAGLLIVPARTSGGQSDIDGITLFAVNADSDGVTRKSYPTVDGQRAAEITLRDVRVTSDAVLGEPDGAHRHLAAVVEDGTLAICAEAVGIIRTMHDRTLEYIKNRTQFGVPIGTFQALQHRMVDTLMACEQSRSLLLWSVMVNVAGGVEALQATSAMKYQVGTAGVAVAREAVQLHGGMGVTWELDIAHYFKRLTAIDLTFGNADFHLRRYIDLTSPDIAPVGA